MNASHSPSPRSAPLGYYTKSVVTLLLWVHFLCLAAAFSGMFNPAQLHQRLVRTLAVYLQPLHLDPGGSWQWLATDYFFALLPEPASNAPALIESGGRFAKLAATIEQYAENEEWPALVSKTVAGPLLRRQLQTAGRIQVRRWKTAASQQDLKQSEVIYEADVWFNNDGELQLLKHIVTPDAAPALRESLP